MTTILIIVQFQQSSISTCPHHVPVDKQRVVLANWLRDAVKPRTSAARSKKSIFCHDKLAEDDTVPLSMGWLLRSCGCSPLCRCSLLVLRLCLSCLLTTTSARRVRGTSCSGGCQQSDVEGAMAQPDENGSRGHSCSRCGEMEGAIWSAHP